MIYLTSPLTKNYGLTVFAHCCVMINESLSTPVIATIGYFPQVALLGRGQGLKHISLRHQRRNRRTQSPFVVLSASVSGLAFVLFIPPKTMCVDSKDGMVLSEGSRPPLSRRSTLGFILTQPVCSGCHTQVVLCTLQLFIHELFQIFVEVWRDLQSCDVLIQPPHVRYMGS